MIETIQKLNYILAIFSIAMACFAVFLVIDMRTKRAMAPYIERYGIIVGLITTFVASVLTLVYSEYFGLIPCGLCWLERVALYPQVLLLGTAYAIRDAHIALYGIVISSFGLVISLYHHYIQMGGSQFIACPVAGAGADCAKRFFFEFNFMTFPLMSAFLFVFLIVLYSYMRSASEKQI